MMRHVRSVYPGPQSLTLKFICTEVTLVGPGSAAAALATDVVAAAAAVLDGRVRADSAMGLSGG